MFQRTQDPKQSELHQWDAAHNPSTLAPVFCSRLYKERVVYQHKTVRASLPGTEFLSRDQEMSFESFTSASETADVMLRLREHLKSLPTHHGAEGREQCLYKTEQTVTWAQ